MPLADFMADLITRITRRQTERSSPLHTPMAWPMRLAFGVPDKRPPHFSCWVTRCSISTATTGAKRATPHTIKKRSVCPHVPHVPPRLSPRFPPTFPANTFARILPLPLRASGVLGSSRTAEVVLSPIRVSEAPCRWRAFAMSQADVP